MTKVVNIENVSLNTFQVEIKALMIGNKQMTLSVFRQIPEAELFDDEWKLNGIPWGHINYFWDRCPQFNDTVMHVVWQKKQTLFRDRISNFIYSENYNSSFDGWGNIVSFYYAQKRLNNDSNAIERLKNKRQEAYSRISNLPQLFIAL